MTTPIESQFVQANGLRLHLLRSGAGPRALLFLHGWPEWSHVWRPVMSRLTASKAPFELIAPDLRGFGASEKPSAGPAETATPELIAEDLLALLDVLGIARVGIVAHDVGSFVAQVMARRAPERVDGLFFFNCAYPGIGRRWIEPGHLLQTWYQFFHQQPWAAELVGSSRDACRIYLRNFLQHWSYRKNAFDDQLETWVDNFMRPGNLQGGFNWYRSIHAARMAVVHGLVAAPAPIDIPTRVFWGAHDPVLLPVWTDRLPEFFTRLRCDLAPDAGHFVHVETPDAASSEIAAFFGPGGPTQA
ncbi:MAG: hypothetical protein RIQ60_2035 [Pseudomonadota bacterium]